MTSNLTIIRLPCSKFLLLMSHFFPKGEKLSLFNIVLIIFAIVGCIFLCYCLLKSFSPFYVENKGIILEIWNDFKSILTQQVRMLKKFSQELLFPNETYKNFLHRAKRRNFLDKYWDRALECNLLPEF